jgi:hypothetical protein
LLRSFDTFAAAYRVWVDWESADALEGRSARLLPILPLARVDGKSPLEHRRSPARGPAGGGAWLHTRSTRLPCRRAT